VKLAQIRQFVTLAEEGNFHRAARTLNIAQPPLSVSIRKLEEELGTALFLRDARGVSLTEAGTSALPSARLVLFHAEELRRSVHATLSGEHGRLRIGFVASATYELLPRLLLAYRKQFPQVEIKLEEGRTSELLNEVAASKLDIAIVRTPILTHADVKVDVLEHDHLYLAVPKDSRWAGRKELQLKDLSDEPFVMFSRERVPSMHAISMALCQREGFVPKVAEEAGQLQTILCLVESGIGVALVPGVSEHQASRVDLIPIAKRKEKPAIGLGLVIGDREVSNATLNFRKIAIALGNGKADTRRVSATR
jgi:DNA-binding transcriptional LysR family regulator